MKECFRKHSLSLVLPFLTCLFNGLHYILVRPLYRFQSIFFKSHRHLGGRCIVFVHADYPFATFEALSNYPFNPFAIGAVICQVHHSDGHTIDALTNFLFDVIFVVALDSLLQ